MSDRYNTVKKFRTNTGRRHYSNPIYPEIPVSEDDIYIITSLGDRYDVLAQEFYGESELWWILPISNPGSRRDSLIPYPGQQLRIPSNKEQIISLFESENRDR